jgi:hypothetical protein
MTTIDTMTLAVIAVALGAPFGAGVARAAESRATAATELTAEQKARTEETKYANIAEQNRQLASKPAASPDAPVMSPDSGAITARQYEKIAALAEKIAANARKVAELHAKAAAALQAQAGVTAKPAR